MKAKDIKRVSAQKQGFFENGLLLKVSALTDEVSHIGIVVSKKVAKQAVRRNRIRRVLREAAQKEMSSFKKNWDLALIVLPGFELPDFKEAQSGNAKTFGQLETFFNPSYVH